MISTGTSEALACLCLSAAFFAPLILEKIDMSTGASDGVDGAKDERRESVSRAAEKELEEQSERGNDANYGDVPADLFPSLFPTRH